MTAQLVEPQARRPLADRPSRQEVRRLVPAGPARRRPSASTGPALRRPGVQHPAPPARASRAFSPTGGAPARELQWTRRGLALMVALVVVTVVVMLATVIGAFLSVSDSPATTGNHPATAFVAPAAVTAPAGPAW